MATTYHLGQVAAIYKYKKYLILLLTSQTCLRYKLNQKGKGENNFYVTKR